MTHETLDLIELGQAEALIEFGMATSVEEVVEKYEPGVAAYVEFE